MITSYYKANTYPCDNCSCVIKDYASVSNGEKCLQLVEDNEIMKKNINSVLNFPEEIKFDFFNRNHETLENVLPSQIRGGVAKYTILHKQRMMWRARAILE